MATIAANNNPEIGKKLAEAMKLVGATNGVITVEEGKTAETEVVVVQGMQFDRGYLSPHFVTNQDTVTVELENPYILIYEEKISSAKSLIPLLETISKKKEPLLIIAEDIEGDALATLVLNKLKGILQVCAVKAPGYGDRRKAMLEDIATLTGGRAIFKDLGIQLENIQLRDLGRAKKVRVDAENTTITEGAGDKKAIEGRAEMIRREIEHDRQRIRPREAAGTAGQAGRRRGPDQGRGRHRDRNEGAQGPVRRRPARHAGRPGRGHRAGRRRGPAAGPQGPGQAGTGGRRGPGRATCFKRVLEMPCRWIAENAGLDGTVVVNNIRRSKEKNYGYDAETRHLHRPAQGRHRRSRQGYPQRLAERGQRCLPAADHRIPGRRHPREGKEGRLITTNTAWAAWVAWAAWAAWVAWVAWVAWAAWAWTCKRGLERARA